jgi:hypothetical protein
VGDLLLVSLPTTSLGSVVAQYDDTPVQFQGSPCGIYGRESGNGQVSFEVFRFYPVHNHFINASYSFVCHAKNRQWVQ